jgi:hypothetical protein
MCKIIIFFFVKFDSRQANFDRTNENWRNQNWTSENWISENWTFENRKMTSGLFTLPLQWHKNRLLKPVATYADTYKEIRPNFHVNLIS